MKFFKSKLLLTILTFILTIGLFFLSIIWGNDNISFIKVLKILYNKIIVLNYNVEESVSSIVWDIRMPRVLLALMVGGALSISGVCLQSILKNPIASPYTLGISSGASLFVGVLIIFKIYFIGEFTIPLFGFFGGLITTLLVIIFSNKIDKNLTSDTIILVGVILSLFISSILVLLTSISHTEIGKVVMWQMGSLSLKDWKYVWIFLPFLVLGFLVIMRYNVELDIMSLGDNKAKTIGVNVKRVKLHIILATSILIGGSVAIAGIIGFVGLVIPHIVRKIFGYRHLIVLPLSFIYGGIFLMLSDMISKNIVYPSELPIGAITSCIGVPFFIFIFFFKRRV